MAANIPTLEDITTLFEQLTGELKAIRVQIADSEKETVGFWNTKKLHKETGIPASTLHLWRKNGWLKEGKDYSLMSGRYLWKIASIRGLIEKGRDQMTPDEIIAVHNEAGKEIRKLS